MNVMDMMSLKGKIALVTGGASKYGVQMTRALAEGGAKTYIASRSIDDLERTAKMFRDEGYEVYAIQYDQGDIDSINNLRDEIIKREGDFDILVNGTFARIPVSWEGTDDAFDKSVHINITGLFQITRAFLDIMVKNKKGSIINIGSIYGMVGYDSSLYAGTPWETDGFASPLYWIVKSGMIGFTTNIASQFGKYNIRCNCISAGGLYTDETPESFLDKYNTKTCLGRMADNTDLMGTILYLASDASTYVTGVNIPVDGGLTSK